MARQPDDTTNAKFKSSDSALIRELALLLDETSLTEIEIERAGLRVRVARNISIAASMPANFQAAASTAASVDASTMASSCPVAGSRTAKRGASASGAQPPPTNAAQAPPGG